MQYLKGSKFLLVVFSGDLDGHEAMKLYTFFDASYASDLTTLKSHSGSLHKLAGGVITATSKQQTIVAQSSTEAEYYAGAKNAMESAYIRQVLEELGYRGDNVKCVETYEDN